MEPTDIVIAGAGPAGCTFALMLSNEISAIILERNERSKLGHDWIDAFDRGIVKNYDEILKYVEKVADSASTKFYSPDGTTNLEAPLSDRIDIDRKVLAKNLINAIERKSNIQIIYRASVKAPLIEGNCVTGVSYLKDNQERSIKTKLVVDATGYYAILRKNLPEEFGIKRELEKGDTILAYRKYIKRPDNMKLKEFKVFFGKYHGISWINTEIEEIIDLFAGVPNLPNHKDPREIVRELESLLLAEYGDQIDVQPVRANYGGVLPTRRCLDSLCGNGFLLIGDSACQIEPISGSGIASSMLAGYLAAAVVNELLKNGKKMTKENLWQYNYNWIEKAGSRYASIDIVRLYLLSRTEEELNFLLKSKIITEKDLKSSLTGEKMRMSLTDLLQKLFRGMARLGLLMSLYEAINDSNKIREIYLTYPADFNELEFGKWQQKKDKVFKKYYKMLRKKFSK